MVFGHAAQRLAADEDDALATTARDADVGVTGLTRSVYHAPHNGHANGGAHVTQPALHLAGHANEVDLRPAAGRTAHQLGPHATQPQGAQKLPGHVHLLHRVGSEREAHGVAYPLPQQRSHRHAVLYRPLPEGARLGDAHMERVVGQLAREHAVGLYGNGDRMRLCREHDVAKATVLEVPHERLARGDELLRQRKVAALRDVWVERAGVNANPNGDARLSGSVDYGVHAVHRTDVARVHPQRRRAALCRGNGEQVIEVDVSHHGQLAPRADGLESLQRVLVGDRHAHDLATRVLQATNLPKRGGGVGGARGAHGLHAHRRATANRHTAYLHLARKLARTTCAFLTHMPHLFP